MSPNRIINVFIGKYLAQPQYLIEILTGTDFNEDGEPMSRQIHLPPGIPNRDAVIDAIIVSEYPRDKMQAVQNNYLLDMDDAEAKSEMAAMQAWRKLSKSIADEFMEYLANNSQ